MDCKQQHPRHMPVYTVYHGAPVVNASHFPFNFLYFEVYLFTLHVVLAHEINATQKGGGSKKKAEN